MGGALDRDGGYPRFFARFWAYSSPARWYRTRRTRYDLLALCLRHRACGAVAAANVVAAKAKLAKACRWRVTDFGTGACGRLSLAPHIHRSRAHIERRRAHNPLERKKIKDSLIETQVC